VTRPVPSVRTVAAAVAVVGAVIFVTLTVVLVPWHPVPGGGPSSLPAPDTVLSPEQLARAEAYAGPARWLGWSSLLVSLVVVCWLGFTEAGARLVGRLRGWWWVRVTLGCFLLLLIGELVTLPLALAIRHNALQAGLTNQDLAGWLRDDLVGLLVSTVFTAIGAMVLIGLARRLPRVWPLCAGVLSALLVVLGSFVYPLVVEPLFNRFTSLPAGPLRTSILRLAAVEHVRVDDVLVADASRRTTSLNAYVTGFGSTRRVVLYDNTVNDLKQAEIESVVAHELGHARHDDVLLGTVLGACGAALGVGLLGLIVARPGVRRRSGITGMADPRAVALLLALTAAASFLASPVENTISRAIEARADLSALDATRDPVAFVELQKQLAISSLQQPAPPEWDQLWFGSHPTPVQRIGMARTLAKAYDEGAR